MHTTSNYHYQVGGSLERDAPSYGVRQADEDFYQALKAGEFCYVLNSRQMGKSSLRVRVMSRLQTEGIACSVIDITSIGSRGITASEWYWGVVRRLSRAFRTSIDLKAWWQERAEASPVDHLSQFIEEVLLVEVQSLIVIFIDEIDSILNLDFKDDFFALIRTCYNQRAENPAYRRLTFALLGVATPSDLIQDTSRTPFNIGRSIELRGLQLDEAKPLAQGLQGKAEDAIAVLRAILNWTGGQPFLTQKVCQCVQAEADWIPVGQEADRVEAVVQSRLIKNWEGQDEPEHLRTIQNQLLRDEERKGHLLGLYQQVLQQGTIPATASEEQIRLRLSGLVVEDRGQLKPHNRVYAAVFDQVWAERILAELRPYAESISSWLQSERQDESRLLRGQALQDARKWAEDKSLGNDDRRFLDASLEAERRTASRRSGLSTAIAAGMGIVAMGSFLVFTVTTTYLNREKNHLYEQYAYCPREKGRPGEKVGETCFRNLKTSGDVGVFLSSTNFQLDQGIAAFKKGNYEAAITRFKEAIDGDRTDPVPQIFLNNALARQHNQSLKLKPLKLAAVVSADYYEAAAIPVLRGVADAQAEFNRKRTGTQAPLMEIVIANDENEPEAAKKIAHELVKDRSILGIIGHHASESTSAAQPIYATANIPIVSPTSSSSQLKGKQFFRAVGNTQKAAEAYANHIRKSLGLDKIVVFYKKGSEYSEALKDDFKEKFAQQRGTVLKEIEIGSDTFHVDTAINDMVANVKVKAALVISSVRTNSISIAINRKNANLPSHQKLQLLGAISLSEYQTLGKGGKAVEGMILLRPCLFSHSKSDYMKKAAARWEQREMDWRIATSYDAAQAFAKAIQLSTTVTREEILRQLQSPSFSLTEEETSGYGLKWNLSDRSNANRNYCVVQIKDGRFLEQSSN
jgi:ABC-type branched-subunit amino acid transport system substrate-binding protein